ncbi:arginine-fifty homeobox [Lepus europaeus]|uniref:arginine-fifty homeobox n=1 Tax=Lepus europaeus TaxID=9983 RepID=UPI002B48CB0D|nr:arginine-fifty homeobox [Lepus europaeus]
MTSENPQRGPFINMNLVPQSPAYSRMCKKHQRTSFTHQQLIELEAVFSQTMFPDKKLKKELAMKFSLPESSIKVWFRNRRFKQKKQQQQSLKQLNQVLQAGKTTRTLPGTSTDPYSFFPMVSDSHSSLPPQPLNPCNLEWDSPFAENPTNDFQMQDLHLERLVASVPALYPGAWDIAEIIYLYSFPDEDELSRFAFHSLFHYLSPTRPHLEEQGSTCLRSWAGEAVGLSPGPHWTNTTRQGFAVTEAD